MKYTKDEWKVTQALHGTRATLTMVCTDEPRVICDTFSIHTMDNAKLIAHINKHQWWRTALPSGKAVEARGVFCASSYREAEFYGRPIDMPFRVNLTNPLFGDETCIMQTLGLLVPNQDISTKERFALDAKMMQLAARKGYDSIALVTSIAYKKYLATGTIPRSIELQVFSETSVGVIHEAA